MRIITVLGPEGERITRDVHHDIGQVCAYNHGIAGLTLSELYGTRGPDDAGRMQQAIQRAVRATLEMQRWRKDQDIDIGGWRYVDDFNHEDSDLSITGWQLMFLRSARNAGFDHHLIKPADLSALEELLTSLDDGPGIPERGVPHRSQGTPEGRPA